MKYTSDLLIDAIKRNAGIPTSQKKFQNSDFLAFLNEELGLTVVGELVALNEDYFITTKDTALVASTSRYAIPVTAIGWKLDSIGHVDSNGSYRKLDKITRSQRDMYDTSESGTSPWAYYVEGNNIVTVPDMGSNVDGSLRFDIIEIQNELVLSSSCGLISSVTDLGSDYRLTVGSVPSTDDGVDIISGTNPFNIIAQGKSATVSSPNVTVSQDDFSRAPVAGDYVAPYGQTPIPNIPEDYHPILAQAATIRCLIAMNDNKGLQTANLSLSNMIERMRNRSKRRVNSSPTKIVPTSPILNLMRGW